MTWWRRRYKVDAELDRELRLHIERLTDEKIAAGVPADEARRRAMLEFGGQQQFIEEVRDVYRIRAVESGIRNLRSALRFVATSPSFSATIIATLALGIGANTAVFSAIDAILLRPMPFPNGDQLMQLTQYNPQVKSSEPEVAPVRLEDWNSMNSSFQALTGYYTQDVSERSGALPEKVTEAQVAPRFLEVWGVPPAIGRDFAPEDFRFPGPSVVMLSDRFWRRRFSADPSVIGKKLRVDSYSYSIIGVLPASFLFPNRDVDLWLPVPLNAPYTQDRASTWYTVIGRLKPGVTPETALADLNTVQARLGEQYPKTDGNLAVRIQPLKEVTIGGVRQSLWILFGSVTVLLLIACTNIAALLLARTTERQREVSIRYSLGASRASILMQLLTEVFVLASAGSALGLAVAAGASQAFRALARNLPRVDEIGLDVRLVFYTFLCAVLTTLVCGLFPAICSTRRELAGSLAQGSRTQVRGRNPLQWTLVSVQVALAVMLLVGAGLLLRSFDALERVSPGFDPSHVLTFHISAHWAEGNDRQALRQRINRTLDELRTVPGVDAAATTADLPGLPNQYQQELQIVERQADPNRKIMAKSRVVSPGYFATLRISLVAGESCRESAGPMKVVVNRNFVDTYMTGLPAIGNHVQNVPLNPYVGTAVIAGVVADAREEGYQHEPVPTIYWCFSAFLPNPAMLVRTHGRPMALAEIIRRKIHEIEPARSVYEIMPLEEHIRDTLAENRLRTTLLAFFALTAVSLACVGLYGTLNYAVNIRRREVGLRLAVGALRRQIVSRFVWEGLRASLLGCVTGLILAAGFTRLLSGMLYGISALDAPTFAGVPVLVLLTGMLSALIPAARAARVEPMQVLREE